MNSLEKSVDVNNDAQMVELGIRPPKWYPIVFNRDPKSKVHKERLIHKHDATGSWSGPIKRVPLNGKLIVYMDSIVDKTTHSHTCGQSDISRILGIHEKSAKVLKYSWNGKTYNKTTLPSYYRGM